MSVGVTLYRPVPGQPDICATPFGFTARFRRYSPYNALLIHAQMPGATFVAPPSREAW